MLVRFGRGIACIEPGVLWMCIELLWNRILGQTAVFVQKTVVSVNYNCNSCVLSEATMIRDENDGVRRPGFQIQFMHG